MKIFLMSFLSLVMIKVLWFYLFKSKEPTNMEILSVILTLQALNY